jgi:hypothetical protein
LLDHLARLEAQGLRARPPPAAGRLPAGLAGLQVIPGRILRKVAVDLAPLLESLESSDRLIFPLASLLSTCQLPGLDAVGLLPIRPRGNFQ